MARHTLQSERVPVRVQANNTSRNLYIGLWCLFFVVYARPQDIITPLQYVHPVVLVLGVLIVAVLVSNKAGNWNIRSPYFSVLLVFLGTMVWSIPFSYHDGESFWAMLRFGMLVIMCYLIIRIVDSFDRIEKIIVLQTTVMVILAVDIARKYLGGESHGQIHGMLGAQFTNPNDLSVSFVLFMPMLYYFFLVGKNWFFKIGSLGSIGLLLFAIVGCQSRGGMLGAALVLGLLLLKTKKKAIIFMLGILILPVLLVLLPEGAFERLETLSEYQKDGSAVERIYFWESSIKMLLNRPFTGVGLSAWTQAYAIDYRHPLHDSNRWPDTHSSYFQIIGELGIPGTVVYFLLYYITFRSLRRLERAMKYELGLERQLFFIQCLRVGIIGFMFTTIFQTYSYYNTIYTLMALVAAMERVTLGHIKSGEMSAKPGLVYARPAQNLVYNR